MTNKKENLSTTQPLNHSTSTNPTVSVIMNCLNCEKYLREAIDSVYAQTYKDWEIIFWDNASTDSSAEIAKSYDERLRYFRGEETVLLGAARNKALEQAKGEFIAFLDCDDLWMPEKLEKQIPLFDDPKVGLVYSNFYYLDDKSGKKRIAYKKAQCPSGEVFRDFLINYRLNMQTVMIRNLPDDRFDSCLTVCEEYELFMKILYRSNAQYVSQPLAIYRFHSSMYSRKHINLYPYEMEVILKRFDSEFDRFQRNFTKERLYLMFKIEYWKARMAMAVGDRKKALKYLFRARGFWWKKISLIVLALLGQKVWQLVHTMTYHYS